MRRSGEAHGRSSTSSCRDVVRSPARQGPAPARSRCPHARRTTCTDPTPHQEGKGHPPAWREPPKRHRRGHARLSGRILGLDASSDPRPEPHPIRPPSHRGTPWRRNLTPIQLNRPLPFPNTHTAPPSPRCCDHRLTPPGALMLVCTTSPWVRENGHARTRFTSRTTADAGAGKPDRRPRKEQ